MSISALPLTTKLSNHYWSDWAGAAFFIVSAAIILARGSQFSILLIPIVAHEVLVAISFLWRTKSNGQSGTWFARGIAYGATFAFPVLAMLVQMWQPQWLATDPNTHLTTVGGWLWICGSLFELRALWFLRRSFSIEPEARELVTKGPYIIARHPIYTSRILQYSGILLIRPSISLGLILAIWFVLMFARARFEEQVLRSAFPDYEAYCRKVGMFGPRLFHRTSPRRAAVTVVRCDIRTQRRGSVELHGSEMPGKAPENCPALTAQ